MPLRITVGFDLARFASRLDALGAKQVPFAASRALNDVTKLAATRITEDLPHIFDRPVPFTMQAVGTSTARKSDLNASVFIKAIQAKYLLPEEVGGVRTPATNTNHPAARALILPAKIERDQWGNIPSGALHALRQVVADEDAGKTRGSKARRAAASKGPEKVSYATDTGIAYFHRVGPKGGTGGYFVRLPGHHLSRLTSFATSVHYKPIFGFRDRVQATVRASFIPALIARLREAMATAR